MRTRAGIAILATLLCAACETKGTPTPATTPATTPAPQTPTPTPTPAPETPAASERTEFRALGNEPGWILVITDSITTLEWDYGEQKTRVTTTAAQTMPGGRRYSFAGATTFSVIVRDTLCADGMSGREFSARVQVTIGTRTLDGCGGTPGPMPAGTP